MEDYENAQALALRRIDRCPHLPHGLAEGDHARVTEVGRTARRRRQLLFRLRVYFACGNMAALNEDFS
jgi:hypothetical protein